MVTFFLRIASLDLSHILYEAEGPYVLKTEAANFFKKLLACLKTGKNDPKFTDLYILPLRPNLLRELVH